MNLGLCASCARHVRATETACPFCGASEIENREALSSNVSRVARSAVIASAIVVAASGALAACSSVTPEPAYGCAPPCGQPVDAGGDTPVDG